MVNYLIEIFGYMKVSHRRRKLGSQMVYAGWRALVYQCVLKFCWERTIFLHHYIEKMFRPWLIMMLMSMSILMWLLMPCVFFPEVWGLDLMLIKKLFSFREVMASNWSQLPNDLISPVVNRLPTIEDVAAFSLVCNHWHSVCSNMNWTQGPRLPRLMLSENPNSNRRSFFSLYNNVCYELELPMVRGRQCYGTAQGWIIAVGPDFQAHLLHPLCKVMIELPVLSALQNQVSVPIDWFNIIQKFIAFKISNDQFLVMAIYGPSNCLAYVKPGDSEWVIVEDVCNFKDVTFFQGHYYALCGRGVLKLCELSGPDSEVQFVDLPPRDLKTADKIYLVESSGKLFAVFRYGSANVSDKLYKTESFLVYKYQFDVPDDCPLPRWARVKDLEDSAFFVGNGNSLSVCAGNTVNCKRNRIYFTDDNWGRQKTIGGTYGGHDIGAFDMATKEIECLNFGVDTPSDYSRPILFTPTLR